MRPSSVRPSRRAMARRPSPCDPPSAARMAPPSARGGRPDAVPEHARPQAPGLQYAIEARAMPRCGLLPAPTPVRARPRTAAAPHRPAVSLRPLAPGPRPSPVSAPDEPASARQASPRHRRRWMAGARHHRSLWGGCACRARATPAAGRQEGPYGRIAAGTPGLQRWLPTPARLRLTRGAPPWKVRCDPVARRVLAARPALRLGTRRPTPQQQQLTRPA